MKTIAIKYIQAAIVFAILGVSIFICFTMPRVLTAEKEPTIAEALEVLEITWDNWFIQSVGMGDYEIVYYLAFLFTATFGVLTFMFLGGSKLS